MSSAARLEKRREGEAWLIEERYQLCSNEGKRQRVGGEANETARRMPAGKTLGMQDEEVVFNIECYLVLQVARRFQLLLTTLRSRLKRHQLDSAQLYALYSKLFSPQSPSLATF
jgi:hypothetical protein